MRRETPWGEIEVQDAHAHLFSRSFFETLIRQSSELSQAEDPLARVAERTGWTLPPEDPARLAADWVRELTKHRVARVLLMASVPGDEASIATATAAFPDRISGAFFIDPTPPGSTERVRRAFDELGLQVACLFPAMHGYRVSQSDGVRSIAELARQRPGTALFVHCGVLSVGVRQKLGLPSYFDQTLSSPLELARVAAEFPSVPFLVPHFGAGMLREALMLADLCSNVHLDTSGSHRWMRYDPSVGNLADVFRQTLAVVGPERLLFGTDSSFFPRGWQAAVFEQQVAVLAELGTSREAAEAILGGNLGRLLARQTESRVLHAMERES
jgi:predicted TIM-barrel fold metal-dependent hydrolase